MLIVIINFLKLFDDIDTMFIELFLLCSIVSNYCVHPIAEGAVRLPLGFPPTMLSCHDIILIFTSNDMESQINLLELIYNYVISGDTCLTIRTVLSAPRCPEQEELQCKYSRSEMY